MQMLFLDPLHDLPKVPSILSGQRGVAKVCNILSKDHNGTWALR